MTRSLLFVLTLAALIPMSAFAGDKKCESDDHFSLVTRDEVASLVDKHAAFVIDVNSKESFKANHVPGAVHFEAVKDNLASVLPADKSALIIAYCGGPTCEAWLKAASAACSMGYTNIKHFKGGISGWLKKS